MAAYGYDWTICPVVVLNAHSIHSRSSSSSRSGISATHSPGWFRNFIGGEVSSTYTVSPRIVVGGFTMLRLLSLPIISNAMLRLPQLARVRFVTRPVVAADVRVGQFQKVLGATRTHPSAIRVGTVAPRFAQT